MRIRFLAVSLLGSVCVSFAARADAEHDRIANERATANARFAGQQRDCESRFVVAPCLEEARKENRAALAQLRQDELKLDEGQRRAAADARRKAIAEKLEAQQGRASDASSESPRVRVRRQPVEPAAPVVRNGDLPAPRTPVPAAERPSLEQRNTERFQARAREAQAHRDAVARRNLDRAAKGKTAPPLPAPHGASSPA